MAFKIVAHTADVRLSLTAESFAGLFGEGVAGLMKIMKPIGLGAAAERRVEVVAADRTSLLIDFLNEVLTQAHINREAYTKVADLRVTGLLASGRLLGHKVGGFENDVKAVTYHEAEVKEENGQWSVNLVLDV